MTRIYIAGGNSLMSIPLVRVHAAEDVRLDTVDMPVIGTDDILLQVSLCGICGSDLGYIAMGGLGLTQPMPLGHELVGKVVQLGDQVRHLSIGDRVVVNPMAGGNSIGNGGAEGAFTPFLRVKNVSGTPGSVLRIPECLSNEEAAMVEPLSVALHGCRQGQAQASDKAVILGAGPIGLCTAICLQYLGLQEIVVVDISRYRLAAAERIGVTAFKAGGDLSALLMQQHGQSDVMGMPVPGTDLYIEATGAKPVFENLLNTAKTGSRIVVVGLHKQPVSVDLANVLLRELHLTGSMAYTNEFPEVIDMLASKSVDISPVISHHFPLTHFNEALIQAQKTDEAIKVLVDCQS